MWPGVRARTRPHNKTKKTKAKRTGRARAPDRRQRSERKQTQAVKKRPSGQSNFVTVLCLFLDKTNNEQHQTNEKPYSGQVDFWVDEGGA